MITTLDSNEISEEIMIFLVTTNNVKYHTEGQQCFYRQGQALEKSKEPFQ